MKLFAKLKRHFSAREASTDKPDGTTPAVPLESELLPGEYWHFTDDSSVNFLFNNVWVGKGWLDSMSATRRKHGNRLVTLGDSYPLTGSEAEAIWEKVRAQHFPRKPSRLGALFMFDRRDLAQANAAKWKPGLDTVVLRARMSRAACVHRGHIGWFDAFSESREQDAAQYWKGDPCPDPPDSWEYVVDGTVYFPDWRTPPFGSSADDWAQPPHTVLGPTEVVICPVCGIEFKASPPKAATLTTADREKCIEDPDLPLLFDCPHVAPLMTAAWERLGG